MPQPRPLLFVFWEPQSQTRPPAVLGTVRTELIDGPCLRVLIALLLWAELPAQPLSGPMHPRGESCSSAPSLAGRGALQGQEEGSCWEGQPCLQHNFELNCWEMSLSALGPMHGWGSSWSWPELRGCLSPAGLSAGLQGIRVLQLLGGGEVWPGVRRSQGSDLGRFRTSDLAAKGSVASYVPTELARGLL